METREELMEMRSKLRDRLATETYRISAHNEEQLDQVARVLAGIQAIDMVIEYDLDPPSNDGPVGFFTS